MKKNFQGNIVYNIEKLSIGKCVNTLCYFNEMGYYTAVTVTKATGINMNKFHKHNVEQK